ncbi:MAG: oxygen-dependent coproporphyrinogen oxidase [Calditrichia bacterium]
MFTDRFNRFEKYIRDLQDEICDGLSALDSVGFREDKWERPGGGGGRTRIIEGEVFEKGGVNISSVHGELPPEMARALEAETGNFAACGLSLVIHPFSPKIPTTHMNVRYFELANGDNWFGGGIDLTPYFPAEADFVHFHKVLYEVCNRFAPNLYPEAKAACDQYFYLPHREEMRGIGGIFFDHFREDRDYRESFTMGVGKAFLEAYLPIIQKHLEEPFTAEDKEFQLIRRGRYVEFNLLYDRGTIFGLRSRGRTESILMSLPAEVRFPYLYQPSPGTPHEKMMRYYQPVDWLSFPLPDEKV